MAIHDSLIAAIDFDGDVTEVTEYASAVRLGVLSGDAAIVGSGHASDGLRVQGAGELVFPTWSALRTSQISIALWLYLPQLPSVAGGTSPKVLVQRGNGQSDGYSIRIEAGDALTFSIVDLAFSVYSTSHVLTAGDVGRWIPIVGAQDESSIRLYVDGVLVGSSLVDGVINNSLTEDLHIGTNLDGTLDEIMIWGRGLQETGTDQNGVAINETTYATDDGSGRFYPQRVESTNIPSAVGYRDQVYSLSSQRVSQSSTLSGLVFFMPTGTLDLGSVGGLVEWALRFTLHREVDVSVRTTLFSSDDSALQIDAIPGGLEFILPVNSVTVACDITKLIDVFFFSSNGYAWVTLNGGEPLFLREWSVDHWVNTTPALALPLHFSGAGIRDVRLWGSISDHRPFLAAGCNMLPDDLGAPLLNWWRLYADGTDSEGGDDAVVVGSFDTVSVALTTPEVYSIFDSFTGLVSSASLGVPFLYADSPFFLAEWPRNPSPRVTDLTYDNSQLYLAAQGLILPTDTAHINYYWEVEVKPGKIYMHILEERIQDPMKYSLVGTEVADAIYLPAGFDIGTGRIRLVVTANDGRAAFWASEWIMLGSATGGEPPEGAYKSVVVVNVYDWTPGEDFVLGRPSDILSDMGGDYTWDAVIDQEDDRPPAIVNPESRSLSLRDMRAGRYHYRITGQWGDETLTQDFILLVRESATGRV